MNSSGLRKTYTTEEMASLGPAVNSLHSSLALLNSSISILDEGVNDFPRLCKVLQTQQHFVLLPEPVLRDAQQSLLEEITPAITQLLSTAEAHIEQMARREQSLRARYELLQGRLGRRQSTLEGGQKHTIELPMTDSKMLELNRLKQKKERLHYAVQTLEWQSKQRERELRRSMHVPKD